MTSCDIMISKFSLLFGLLSTNQTIARVLNDVANDNVTLMKQLIDSFVHNVYNTIE